MSPANNDLGFWESVPISEAHDRFLASIGSAWDDVSPIPPSVFASARADAFIDELAELLLAEYGDSSLFVVKDPRLCRLIPIWIAALERFGARPSFVDHDPEPVGGRWLPAGAGWFQRHEVVPSLAASPT